MCFALKERTAKMDRPLGQSSEKRGSLWERRYELTQDEVRKIAQDASERELTDEEEDVLLCRLGWADEAKTALIITKPISRSDCSGVQLTKPGNVDPKIQRVREFTSRAMEAEHLAMIAEKDAAEANMIIGVIWRMALIAILLYATRFLSDPTDGFCVMVITLGGIFWIIRYVQQAEDGTKRRPQAH